MLSSVQTIYPGAKMEETTFNRVRNNQNSYNACAVKAVQAITGIERGKVALCLGYDRTRGVMIDRVIPGLTFLTGKKWIRTNINGIELSQLAIEKGLVVVVNFDDPRTGLKVVDNNIIAVTHMVAVIGDNVFDSLFTLSKTYDAVWKGWKVVAYFHEER